MTISPYLSIVFPVFNESEAIVRCMAKVEEFFKDQGYSYEVILVDDGSLDDSIAKIEAYIKEKVEFRLIKNEHQGKSAAVRTGVLESTGEYVLLSDVDLAVPISETKRFLLWATEHQNDLVFASREGGGAERINEPYYRHLIGRIFNLIIQVLLLPCIQDTQCGFRLFTKKAASDLFPRLVVYGENLPIINKPFFGAFEVEVLFLARKLKYSIKELPVVWTFKPTKRFNFFQNSYKMFRDVVKIRIYDWLGKYK